MKVTRVYSDEAGETHFADEEIELNDAGPIGKLSQPVPVKAVIFRENDPNYDYDWHTAPQKQFIALLDGAIEIEVSDGTQRTFGGGDVLLVEDVTGRGHRTRHIEPRKRRSLFITLQ